MSTPRFNIPEDLNFDDAPPAPAPVDQDDLVRQAVLTFAGKLERWARRQSGGPVIVEHGQDKVMIAVELPRQPGQLRFFNFRVQVVIQEFDGGFV